MKKDVFSIVSLGEDTHTMNMYLEIVLCIRLMYLNIKNFGYMPIVLSLEKCCGHKKEFRKRQRV